jgi:hypothetical protein
MRCLVGTLIIATARDSAAFSGPADVNGDGFDDVAIGVAAMAMAI